MPTATSLNDLIRIRSYSRELIDRINGNLGSALGFKHVNGQSTGQPAILIFVPRKINNAWLNEEDTIPETMDDGNGVKCLTDVIQSSTYDETYLKAYQHNGQPLPPDRNDIVSWSELDGAPPLSRANVELLQILHGAEDVMPAGARLAVINADNTGHTGTLGCFARNKVDGALGILTNQHVAYQIDSRISFPWFNSPAVGDVRRLKEYVTDEQRFDGVFDDPDAFYRVDCAFIELKSHMYSQIDPRLPGLGEIGAPLPLDLNTMGPVGTRIAGVGGRRGLQRGIIVAFAYEYHDGTQKVFTDYLILGDEQVNQQGIELIPTAFSNPGDSGKLIVTDDENHNAVALLWGGWLQRLRPGKMQEDWTYAIDINYVLKTLDLELVTSLSGIPPIQNEDGADMITVTIKRTDAASGLMLKVTLNGKSRTLNTDESEKFNNVPAGSSDLHIVGIIGSGAAEFKLEFTNATTQSGQDNFSDIAVAPDYENVITLKVPS